MERDRELEARATDLLREAGAKLDPTAWHHSAGYRAGIETWARTSAPMLAAMTQDWRAADAVRRQAMADLAVAALHPSAVDALRRGGVLDPQDG